jgi:L-lysine cyclodeaminase
MPHRRRGNCPTIKTVSYSPENPERFGLPTIVAGLARFDDITGRMTVLAEGTCMTAIRTGAASAIASRALALLDSRTIGMIGCGAQAVTQLHGLVLQFPIETVLAWDIDRGRLDSFANRIAFTGLKVQQAPPERIVERADILVTATSVGSGKGPVFPDSATQPHLHVNAVGADVIGKTEVPTGLLKRALVCPDHEEQALREGESQLLRREDLGPTLGQICANPAVVSGFRSKPTVFDSTGIALEDHLVLDVFLDLADRLNIGRTMDIDAPYSDVLNPYSY